MGWKDVLGYVAMVQGGPAADVSMAVFAPEYTHDPFLGKGRKEHLLEVPWWERVFTAAPVGSFAHIMGAYPYVTEEEERVALTAFEELYPPPGIEEEEVDTDALLGQQMRSLELRRTTRRSLRIVNPGVSYTKGTGLRI